MTEIQRTETISGGYGGALAAALLRDAETWTGLQCELLTGVEALWAEWARRQNEAFETSAQAWRRLYDGSGMAELGQIQRDWLAGAARRTAEAIGRWASDDPTAPGSQAIAAESARAAANESAPTARPEREAAE